jgi:glycosyltransferase involved in cell wall biosynthesis
LKEEILLSFVIPVYNVESYLRECVDSILVQASQDVEVILVDDGSPDDCPRICEEYAKRDIRVKVVHKENGGLSSARNAGMKIAKGKYITFVDSDDKVFSESIPEILSWIESGNEDICFLKSVKLFSDGTQTDLGENIARAQLHGKNKDEAIKYLSSLSKYPGSAWAKLFKREFLVNNDLHFPYDRRFSEDLGFIRDCILCADGFDVLEIPYYQYRQSRQGSITNTISSKNFYDLFRFITESTEKLTVNKKPKDRVSEYVMRFVAYEYSVLLYLGNAIPKEQQKDAFSELKKYNWVLRYAGNKKTKIISLVSRLFGLRFTSFLLNKYRKTTKK